MRVKHHYYYEAKAYLISFLEKNKISYKVSDLPESKNKLCTFDLYEDQEAYRNFRNQFFFLSKNDSIKSIEYSKKEIESAEWLTVRSMNTKVQWDYEEKAFRKTCFYKRLFIKELYYRHSEQVDILSVTKTVKWGAKQYFSGPNAADDLLFCSEKAKGLLNNRWIGLEFWPVKKYNSSEYCSDLYQLVFGNDLPVEAISGGESIVCDGCGKKIVRFVEGIQKLEIRKEYLKNPGQVYRTGDVLTEQRKGCTTFSLNIVPQEFYQYCEENRMNRGMIYEPIQLI